MSAKYLIFIRPYNSFTIKFTHANNNLNRCGLSTHFTTFHLQIQRFCIKILSFLHNTYYAKQTNRDKNEKPRLSLSDNAKPFLNKYFAQSKLFLCVKLGKFSSQPFKYLLFKSRYVRLRYSETIGNLFLGHFLFVVETETHTHNFPLSRRKFFKSHLQ